MQNTEKETVILLHGMGRSRASMWAMQQRLKAVGYKTLNFPYSPPYQSIDEMSQQLIHYINTHVKTTNYHFVAHSLGNVIIRNAFKYEYPGKLKRIVMLAPPNRPAKLAQIFKDNMFYKWFTGDSGQKLSDENFYQQLPVPQVEFGVIAGNKGMYVVFEEENDCVVAVENTKLEGMSDWIVVPRSHTFIMNSKLVFEEVAHFFEHGRFQKLDENYGQENT